MRFYCTFINMNIYVVQNNVLFSKYNIIQLYFTSLLYFSPS